MPPNILYHVLLCGEGQQSSLGAILVRGPGNIKENDSLEYIHIGFIVLLHILQISRIQVNWPQILTFKQ